MNRRLRYSSIALSVMGLWQSAFARDIAGSEYTVVWASALPDGDVLATHARGMDFLRSPKTVRAYRSLTQENMPEPPAMHGNADDIARIETVYANEGGLLVEGRFDDPSTRGQYRPTSLLPPDRRIVIVQWQFDP